MAAMPLHHSDMIEAGTFMIASAAWRRRDREERHTSGMNLSAKLQEMNIDVEEGDDWIRVTAATAPSGR